MIKELVNEFEGEIKCLSENTEKHITFSVPIKKKIIRKDKNGNDKIMKISYEIKFIDRFRFMSTSLSSLVDNLSDGLHDCKCTNCGSSFDYMIPKDDKLVFRFSECKKNCEKDFNKELIKRFANTYEFFNGYKFILLLRKGVYPFEYMVSWERFNEKSLPDKKDFYSGLYIDDISDVDHRQENNVFKKIRLKHLGEYHDLYVQSDTLLLADVFQNFRYE